MNINQWNIFLHTILCTHIHDPQLNSLFMRHSHSKINDINVIKCSFDAHFKIFLTEQFKSKKPEEFIRLSKKHSIKSENPGEIASQTSKRYYNNP